MITIPDDYADILREICFNIIAEGEEMGKFGWLYKIARHTYIDIINKKKVFDKYFYLNSVGNGFY